MADRAVGPRGVVVAEREPAAGEIAAEDVREAARVARAVLTELAEPGCELSVSAAWRNRLEGAALALETLAGPPENEP